MHKPFNRVIYQAKGNLIINGESAAQKGNWQTLLQSGKLSSHTKYSFHGCMLTSSCNMRERATGPLKLNKAIHMVYGLKGGEIYEHIDQYDCFGFLYKEQKCS